MPDQDWRRGWNTSRKPSHGRTPQESATARCRRIRSAHCRFDSAPASNSSRHGMAIGPGRNNGSILVRVHPAQKILQALAGFVGEMFGCDGRLDDAIQAKVAKILA